jgi:uncharacterized membrane protein YkoI
MNRRIRLSAQLITVVAAATAGGLALAKQAAPENDALVDLAKAKITLVQAIAAAEGHVGGRATRAELDHKRGAVIFDVEVAAADGKIFDVVVDAIDGNVRSSREDRADGKDCKDDED